MIADRPTVTPQPWPYDFAEYGTSETYRLAAEWLAPCATVADWGGAAGGFRSYLSPTVQYTLVDGTVQTNDQVLADLRSYREPSDGILLRHVIDNTPEWEPVLQNALTAFRQRMVVVTFLEECEATHRIERKKTGWPYWQFHADDLRALMAPHLVRDEAIQTSHAERVFYLERS